MSGIMSFALPSANNNVAAPSKDKPKAEFWINIGYEIEVPYADGTGSEKRFISLPFGTPLDTMEKRPTKSSNVDFRAMEEARNNLLDSMLEAAKSQLKPGEAKIFSMGSNGIGIEIRRVAGEQAPIAPGANPFIKPISF